MPRRPRDDEPGSWHHVLNRGIAKRPLFENLADARYFLSRLALQVRAGRIEIHAFCLMTTHFHLLVRSPRGELSEAMRRAQNDHSRRFNRLRRRDGALVRGRFVSRLVDSSDYRRTLVRYIDLNPERAGAVRPGAVHDLGSAAAYLGGRRPPWLTCGWVQAEACRLSGHETFTPEAYVAAFRTGPSDAVCELVEARLQRPNGRDPLESLILRAPADVRDWMRRKARLADGCHLDLPACSRSALRAVLDADAESGPRWIVEDQGKLHRGEAIALSGLLHELCGVAWSEVGRSCGCSGPTAQRMGSLHRRLLLGDEDYASRVAGIVHEALRRSLAGP